MKKYETYDDVSEYCPINTLVSSYDDRDFDIHNFVSVKSIPSTFSLKNKLPPIRSQGMVGSCVAQTLASIKEYHEYIDVGYQHYMSPMFVYNQRSNKPNSGMYIRDALDICLKKGICPEKDFPYYNRNTTIPQEIYDIALNYTIKAYARIYTVEDVKKALISYGPCIITFKVFNHGTKMWVKKPNDKLRGYHCMAIIGWTKKAFIIRNSWGMWWGDKGYCYYPFNEFGLHTEIWQVIDKDSEYIQKDHIPGCRTIINKFIHRLFN